jgi:hypothetical protein
MSPSNDSFSPSYDINHLAHRDFSRAHRKSFWRSVLSWVLSSDNELLPFDEVLKRVPRKGQHYIGFKQIETDKIIGSVSRFQEFDRAFLPRQTHTRTRWENIDRAYFQDIILPPIEVYQIGEIFFVKDGNHRVSVARERGQAFMDAYVVQIDIPGKMDEHTNLDKLVLEYESSEFLELTRLGQIAPKEDFRFSIPGQFEKLFHHISVHRWFMGEKLNRPVSEEEAASGWFRDVYYPLVKIIRKHKIMKEFPQRTETDLYLWIIEHRWYMIEELRRKVSLESAAIHFSQQFANRPFRQLHQWLKRLFSKIGWKRTNKNQP